MHGCYYEFNVFLSATRVSRQIISYFCTYDLNGPMRNAFDEGSIHYEGKWEGVRP
jgi:hypothetical protein